MPIILIINGFYRTGTTIVSRILKESNPDIYYFHEPTSSLCVHEIMSHGLGKVHGLHGWAIYDDFHKLPSAYLDLFIRKHQVYDFVLEPFRGVIVLDAIHSFHMKSMVKSCHLHLILDIVINRYGCKAIQIVRDAVETFLDVLPLEVASNELLLAKLVDGKVKCEKYMTMFWILDIYNSVSRRFNKYVDENDCIGKFIVAFMELQNYAVKLCRANPKCMILNFDELVEKPIEVLSRVEGFTGLKVNKQLAKYIDKSKAKKSKAWLRKKFEEKMKELGYLS